MNEKIQKVLARAGYGSRRQIEEWIKAGNVKLNDRVAIIGDRVSLHDQLFLHDKLCRIETAEKTRIIMYNKPAGEICTRHDPEGRPTVFSRLPVIENARWINVGRLDINTTGLILFTNDGEIANQLMHPSNQIEREYMVRVLGEVNETMLKNLTHGVKLEDGLARFEEIVEGRYQGANRWFYVVTVEGRNRIVKRLFESQGLTVSRLKRLRFGPVFLPKSLKEGSWMEIDATAFASIKK